MKFNENRLVLMLGGNEGETLFFFNKAMALIEEEIGSITKRSSIYSSEPWGYNNQRAFLNCAIEIQTPLDATEVIQITKNIEQTLGKQKTFLNGPRTIDLDIIFFNNLIINSNELIIPHPRFHNRRFNLVPLCEILPDFIHPVLNKSLTSLLELCDDKLTVFKQI